MHIRAEHALELFIFIVMSCLFAPIMLEIFNYVPYRITGGKGTGTESTGIGWNPAGTGFYFTPLLSQGKSSCTRIVYFYRWVMFHR